MDIKKTQFEEYYFGNPDTKGEFPEFDMICVYNDPDCFINELIGTLKEQKCKYNVRVLAFFNENNQFKSMAEAYNQMIKCVRSDNVIFTHQDIRYGNEKALEEMLEEILLVPANGIWGTGGVFMKSRRIPITQRGNPLELESVDECLFGMKTELCRKLRFNEVLCDNWHMYSAEMCLHNHVENGKVYLIKTTDIWHLSMGVISSGYVKTLYKVINYYKPQGVQMVWTTCAKIDLTKPYHLYIAIWLAKHEVLNKVIRPIRKRLKRG